MLRGGISDPRNKILMKMFNMIGIGWTLPAELGIQCDIGEYISMQSENAEYGDAFVQKLADFFATNYPELKGFNRRGLYRMKQFYELYKDNVKVSTLLTQLSWSKHLKIMSACDINKVEMSVLCLSFA